MAGGHASGLPSCVLSDNIGGFARSRGRQRGGGRRKPVGEHLPTFFPFAVSSLPFGDNISSFPCFASLSPFRRHIKIYKKPFGRFLFGLPMKLPLSPFPGLRLGRSASFAYGRGADAVRAYTRLCAKRLRVGCAAYRRGSSSFSLSLPSVGYPLFFGLDHIAQSIKKTALFGRSCVGWLYSWSCLSCSFNLYSA